MNLRYIDMIDRLNELRAEQTAMHYELICIVCVAKSFLITVGVS